MNPTNKVAKRYAATLLAAVLLLGNVGAALADDTDTSTDPAAQARQRIADVAKEMSKNADSVKDELLSEQVAPDDVPLDLMRYATFRVAWTFFRTWANDKNLARPDSPKCLVEDGAPEASLTTQIANDDFLIGFVQEGHLYEVAAGIAEQICRTFGPQIIRPIIKQAEDGLPPDTSPAPSKPHAKSGKSRQKDGN